jgi:hypothetical protein
LFRDGNNRHASASQAFFDWGSDESDLNDEMSEEEEAFMRSIGNSKVHIIYDDNDQPDDALRLWKDPWKHNHR